MPFAVASHPVKIFFAFFGNFYGVFPWKSKIFQNLFKTLSDLGYISSQFEFIFFPCFTVLVSASFFGLK